MAREVNVYAAADGVFTVSQKEADLINDLIGDPTLAHLVPDGEDLAPSALPFAERKGILFIGNFRHPPNVQAAQYLCGEILPKLESALMAEHPIYIVGNALNETVRGYGAGLANVRMVGWVPSLLPYLQRARVSVVPLLHGAGTKRKLIQALMVGTPTVSTSMGVEGLGLQDGEHVQIADDPATFADSIARLLEDTELWERLARKGRAYITATHSRETVRARFMQTISTVLAQDVKSGGSARAALEQQGFLGSDEGLVRKLNSLEHELHSIKNSRIWRMFGPYRRLRTKLASSEKVLQLRMGGPTAVTDAVGWLFRTSSKQ
jgi:glycosyltransferase involved in cell wall biosynthesis